MVKIESDKEYNGVKFIDLELIKDSIYEAEFSKCKFRNCDFSSTKFSLCRFDRCSFQDCNLSNLKLSETSFNEVDFESCKMIGIDFSLMNTELGLRLDCKFCDLSWSVFYKK